MSCPVLPADLLSVVVSESSGAARFILIKPFIKLNTSHEEQKIVLFSCNLWQIFCGNGAFGGKALLDWHIQMKAKCVEGSLLYLFHIITEHIGNFHHEYCRIPWQPLIGPPHPSGEMMELDGRQTLGVRLHDEGGGGLITLLLPGTEPASQEGSPGPVWDEEDPARHISCAARSSLCATRHISSSVLNLNLCISFLSLWDPAGFHLQTQPLYSDGISWDFKYKRLKKTAQ